MNYIYEIIVVAVITAIFISKKKPKIIYLIYGYLFFFFITLIQIPIKYLELLIINSTNTNVILIPQIISIIFFSSFTEISKYLTLKKFLHIKKINNAILFGIGWVSLKSINTFTIIFMNYIFIQLNFTFNYNYFLKEYTFINFIFFFIFNIYLTILIIKAILKNNKKYFYFAIILNILISILLIILEKTNKLILITIVSSYSLYAIFKYKNIK